VMATSATVLRRFEPGLSSITPTLAT
jgi:hypothetical protein